MENDSIRASGSSTLVDIWIEGKLRAICVTREAIDAYVEPSPPPSTENERCEFVRTHLREIVAAAKIRLRDLAGPADSIIIEPGHLTGTKVGRLGDRRQGDRRKGERRKTVTPVEALPHGERRNGDRRKTQRRCRPKKDA
jgi:hypothetical protein